MRRSPAWRWRSPFRSNAPPASAMTRSIRRCAGRVVGKLVGVFGSSALAIRLGLADLPANAGWLHMLGISLLCGIGFTMSLFIGLLAFAGAPALQDAVKVGILAGSLIDAQLGADVLLTA